MEAAHGSSAGSGGRGDARRGSGGAGADTAPTCPLSPARTLFWQVGRKLPRRVEPWPASLAALAGLVPRPPSELWRSWSYEAGPAAVTASARSVLPCMHLPAATPQPPNVIPAPPLRHSRESGNPGGGAGHPSPRRAATPSTADEERRPPCPQVDADPALLEVLQGAPSRNNPLLAHLRKTPPGPPGPARDPDGSQSKEDHPGAAAGLCNSFDKGAPPGNNSCFAPRPTSKDDKKRRTILQRESIKWHCS